MVVLFVMMVVRFVMIMLADMKMVIVILIFVMVESCLIDMQMGVIERFFEGDFCAFNSTVSVLVLWELIFDNPAATNKIVIRWNVFCAIVRVDGDRLADDRIKTGQVLEQSVLMEVLGVLLDAHDIKPASPLVLVRQRVAVLIDGDQWVEFC